MNFIKELELLLKSRHSIVYIITYEEERLEYAFKTLIENKYDTSFIFCWDFITGFQGNPNDYGVASKNPLLALDFIEKFDSEINTFFILKDFNVFLNDTSVIRKMRNLVRNLNQSSKNIVIIASELNLPNSLQEIVTVLNFPLPNTSEIRNEIILLLNKFNKPVDDFLLNKIIKSCQGLSIERIRRVVFKILIEYKNLSFKSLELILNEKKNIINQTQILEFCPPEATLKDIGGLDNLKEWLNLRSKSFSEQAALYGLPSPKGLMLVGIQGTGKSLTAKVVANEWQLPLLRLDVGKLFGGVVGESESRVRQMIQVAESLAPCVLWIDEIDKAFRGLGMSGDSGTSSRVFASFITWLSEKRSQVFVVATANDIYSLPPELLRKGRFDEVFFISLPTYKERKDIFRVHISRLRPTKIENYDISELSKISDNFSGAEIQQCIVEAMYKAFSEERDFCNQDIYEAVESMVPLSYTHSESIESIQNWALTGKIRSASRI
uniref:hypothetical protein n=1 Tax=Madagascaria erythrocladioides TaxID=753684 RepID=UPI001BF06CC7|nr:hypothetical protein MW574_pgp188 [Madagascaria erythrocladioides]QUE28931.1 Ycf46 [Madagascaria erythrocladioides]UNJ16479.1 hypothetical protein [Madagascaria erythrocladioides]